MRAHLLLGLILSAALTGCSSTEAPPLKASPVYIAKYNALSALDVVAALEANVLNAKETDMAFLAPQYYFEATKILNESQNSLGNKPKTVLANNAAKADALLEKGRTLIPIVKYRFAKELAYKAQMEAHNAPKLLAKDYEKAIAELSKLIKKIELEQTDNIDKEKDALLKSMLDLVIKSVQENALHECEAINNDSKKNNADKLSPLSFSQALRLYHIAKNRIATAYQDKALVQQVSSEALFAARHAQQINTRVVLVHNHLDLSLSANGISDSQFEELVKGKAVSFNKTTVEQIILQEEDRLLAIASAHGLKDMRDQPFEKQIEEIKRIAEKTLALNKSETGKAAAQNCEALLLESNTTKKDSLAALSKKDQQLEAQAMLLVEKEAQLKALAEKLDESKSQGILLSEKYQQIEMLKAKIAELEIATKPTIKPKVLKPRSVVE